MLINRDSKGICDESYLYIPSRFSLWVFEYQSVIVFHSIRPVSSLVRMDPICWVNSHVSMKILILVRSSSFHHKCWTYSTVTSIPSSYLQPIHRLPYYPGYENIWLLIFLHSNWSVCNELLVEGNRNTSPCSLYCFIYVCFLSLHSTVLHWYIWEKYVYMDPSQSYHLVFIIQCTTNPPISTSPWRSRIHYLILMQNPKFCRIFSFESNS